MNEEPSAKQLAKWGAVAVVGVICALFALTAATKAFNRWQKREEAQNQVAVTKINIQKAQEQAKVNYAQIEATKAEARKRYEEAIGIRRAQDEIQATLTPLYVQHEAIAAQLKMANSPNNTIIWAPAGSNGVPFVTDPLRQK